MRNNRRETSHTLYCQDPGLHIVNLPFNASGNLAGSSRATTSISSHSPKFQTKHHPQTFRLATADIWISSYSVPTKLTRSDFALSNTVLFIAMAAPILVFVSLALFVMAEYWSLGFPAPTFTDSSSVDAIIKVHLLLSI